MKLVVAEPESVALAARLREWPLRASSALSLTEVLRALRRARFGPAATRRARAVLARVALVDVDRGVLSAAAALEPAGLRTLDAIHLATAPKLGTDLAVLVTYDRRLRAAAEMAALEVASPV